MSALAVSRVEWAIRCACNDPVHSALENGPMSEAAARAHVAILQQTGHPAVLLRRTVHITEWETDR